MSQYAPLYENKQKWEKNKPMETTSVVQVIQFRQPQIKNELEPE